MDEEANYILRQAGYDIKPWEGFVQRGSTYGGISKSISHDKLKGNVFDTYCNPYLCIQHEFVCFQYDVC